ncbi:MAG: Peptidase [Fibrobacteria bacterium]|jgi:murein DD-endopeptidase MepM/ murein hydrolase activator NlpD|nr:Peptidase [Fibrobacteria bacterium]
MDRKIRIHFFPRDASRVRSIVLSRRLAIALAACVVPLCLLGFWLVLSGGLREDPRRKVERIKLERETRALSEKTSLLQQETEKLRKNLDSLEAVRSRVTLASGLESQQPASPETEPPRFRLFGSGAPRPEDFTRLLARAKRTSQFMDSSLFVLTKNPAMAANLPTIYPVSPEALVTRTFGPTPDPFTGRRNLHPGVDFSLPPGSPVLAAGGGTATTGNEPLWGYYVRVRHTENAETFYAHLQAVAVPNGSRVARGEVIGWLGQSGATTGPHLHFEMRLWGDRVDPLPYLASGDKRRAGI